MDEKYLEMAEEQTTRMAESKREEVARQAIPDEDLKPEEYLTEFCKDCGEDLPEFRKQKGLIRCVPCQSDKEKAKRP